MTRDPDTKEYTLAVEALYAKYLVISAVFAPNTASDIALSEAVGQDNSPRGAVTVTRVVCAARTMDTRVSVEGMGVGGARGTLCVRR